MESTESRKNANKVSHMMIAYYVTLENMHCCKVALEQVVRHHTVSHENINILPYSSAVINPLNPELNPICYLLALLGAHHFLYVSRIRVKLLTFRRLMSYTYGAPILDVSRSHTMTQHGR